MQSLIKVYFFLIIYFFLFISCFQVSAQSKVRLKFATLAPKSIGWANKIQKIFLPPLKQATENNISIKWYWGGVKGDDIEYISLMIKNEIDGAALAGNGIMKACPEMSALALPFLFNNYDEVDYIRNRMYQRFYEILERSGFKLLLWADQDFDQIYSCNTQIKTVDDFKKIIFAGGVQSIETLLFQKLGARHVFASALNIDNYIRQKKANGLIGPSLWVVGSQLYTSFHYISPIKIRYSPAAFIISQKAWNKIPKKYHQKIDHIFQSNQEQFLKKTRADSQRALSAMEKYGLKVTQPSSKDLIKIKETCRPVWTETSGRTYSVEIIDEIQKHLKQFRGL